MFKKTLLCLTTLCSALSAETPQWSLQDTNAGWNTETLASLYFHNSELQRQWAWELLSHVRFSGSEKILDFACGDGKITWELARLANQGHVLGIDMSSMMIHLAHLKFPPFAYPNLEFKRTESLTFSDFPGNHDCDLVCAFCVFHFIKDPVSTLLQLKTHLKPTGKLLLTVPTNENPLLYETAQRMFEKYSLPAPWTTEMTTRNLKINTIEGSSVILAQAGFDILFQEQVRTPNPFYSMEEFIIWMMGTFSANWGIPSEISLSFFTDMANKMYEIDSTIIDEEGRVNIVIPRIHLIASPAQ